MKAAETPIISQPDVEVWPFSFPAYHVLGEAGLIPKNTELLYGVVHHNEVHRQPGNGQLAEKTIHGPGGRLASGALPNFTLALNTFFER